MEKKTYTFTATTIGYGDLIEMIEILRALGIDCDSDAGKISMTLPASAFQARRMRTRGAGRHRDELYLSAPFNSSSTVADFLDWYETHSVIEAMDALGVEEHTLYRRLKKMRAMSDEEKRRKKLISI